jgi:SpoVK/Ycf46/Vps4 family AAA+-type ATPase
MKLLFKLSLFIIFVIVTMYIMNTSYNDHGNLIVTEKPVRLSDGRSVLLNSYERIVLESSHQPCVDQRYMGRSVVVEEMKRIMDTWSVRSDSTSPIHAPPTGVLLHGPPGTGKTTLAHQVCKESNAQFLVVSADILENRYQGESFKLMRAVFTLAKKLEPCIVFFDEIDGIMSKRSEMDQSHTNTMKTLFLSGMDSVKQCKVMVVGATNRPEIIDNALMRRLEAHFETFFPTDDELKAFLKTHLNDEFPKFVDTLVYKTTLHNLMTFIKFCVRRKPDAVFTDQELITLYQEYNTIYSF